MLVGMLFRSLGGVVLGMQVMAVGYVRVMRGFLVITILVMLGCSPMMLGCMFMMIRGPVMMIGMVFGHGILSWRCE